MTSLCLNNEKITVSKVVCIGRNYSEHIKELQNDVPSEMVFFIKPNSSISSSIVFPKDQPSCHYEAELSFLIKDNKIHAVAFGLDMTLREKQSELKKKGLPWERAKSFKNAAVFSDFISCDEDVKDLSLELYINGELKQVGGYELMINKPNDIIKEFNSFNSFEQNDILMSGTPKGVGTFKIKDVFLGKILLNGKTILEKEFIVS